MLSTKLVQKQRLRSAAVVKAQVDQGGKHSRFNEEQLYWSNYDKINRQNISNCSIEVKDIHKLGEKYKKSASKSKRSLVSLTRKSIEACGSRRPATSIGTALRSRLTSALEANKRQPTNGIQEQYVHDFYMDFYNMKKNLAEKESLRKKKQ